MLIRFQVYEVGVAEVGGVGFGVRVKARSLEGPEWVHGAELEVVMGEAAATGWPVGREFGVEVVSVEVFDEGGIPPGGLELGGGARLVSRQDVSEY